MLFSIHFADEITFMVRLGSDMKLSQCQRALKWSPRMPQINFKASFAIPEISFYGDL
jgi:hypothetical protein